MQSVVLVIITRQYHQDAVNTVMTILHCLVNIFRNKEKSKVKDIKVLKRNDLLLSEDNKEDSFGNKQELTGAS